MNTIKVRFQTHLIVTVVAVIFLVLMAVVAISGVTHAGDNKDSQNGRLITIHDRGTEKAIMTQSVTIGDALKEAEIPIDSKDLVEPAVSEKLIASSYEVNIYRARPILVIDGNIRQKIITPYQTAQQITTSAGIVLYPEDITTIDKVDNLTDGAGMQLSINRATPFTFTLYGKTSTVRSQATTVGEMLSEKGIKLGADDRISLSLDTKLTDGLAVRVWREGKQTISADVEIDFHVEKVQDADREVGYRAIKTAGEKGVRSVTYEVTIQDGQEVSRTEIASLTTKNPVEQIEIVGAKYKTFGGSCSEWIDSAGIIDQGSASELIRRESNCNPYSVNKSSGACGIGQALPCSKTGCEMGDGVCQLIWMNQYVIGRYGSWSAALQHSNQYGWY